MFHFSLLFLCCCAAVGFRLLLQAVLLGLASDVALLSAFEDMDSQWLFCYGAGGAF